MHSDVGRRRIDAFTREERAACPHVPAGPGLAWTWAQRFESRAERTYSSVRYRTYRP